MYGTIGVSVPPCGEWNQCGYVVLHDRHNTWQFASWRLKNIRPIGPIIKHRLHLVHCSICEIWHRDHIWHAACNGADMANANSNSSTLNDHNRREHEAKLERERQRSRAILGDDGLNEHNRREHEAKMKRLQENWNN